MFNQNKFFLFHAKHNRQFEFNTGNIGLVYLEIIEIRPFSIYFVVERFPSLTGEQRIITQKQMFIRMCVIKVGGVIAQGCQQIIQETSFS